MSEIDPLLEEALARDREERAFFVTSVNAYMLTKPGGDRVAVRFATLRDADDTLVVTWPSGFMAAINVHMNSIAATAHALAQFLHTEKCTGLIGRWWPDEAPEAIREAMCR